MHKTKVNIFYQTAYQILAIILPLFTAPYISRVLGAENVGYYSYSYSVANYFVLFAMLGINNYGNKLIAVEKQDKERLNKAFSNLFFMHVIVSVLAIAAYLLYLNLTTDNQLYGTICILYVIGALLDINWLFFGLEEFKITVTRNTIFRIVTVCLVFIFVKESSDTWKYILIMASGTVVSQSLIWIAVHKYLRFVKPNLKSAFGHLKPLLILFIPVIAVSVYKVMDKIMINILSSTTQVGFYENAEKVINVPMGIITAVGVVMLSRASALLSQNCEDEVKRSISITTKYVMIIAYAMTMGLIAVGSDFARLFFGEEFVPAGVLIQGLAITIPFISFANIIRTQYLLPKDYNVIYVGSVVAGAVVNFTFNYLFIPIWGANGAVIGTILAEVAVCVIQAVAIRKELSTWENFKITLPFIFIAIIMYVTVKLLSGFLNVSFFSLIVEIIVGVIVYIGLSSIVLFKTKDNIFINLVNRIKPLTFRNESPQQKENTNGK